ncbi:hypothetical protein [Nonomuraea helvata]|uniref:DUF3558 domain-containing protein n=1 Tax=Nonomuraea helvata TaxID=37484 RepID=A0ABV5SIN3_9ACTN
MYQGVHAAILGVILLLGLTACSNDATAAQFNPSQLTQALPSKLSVPQGWEGNQQQVVDGSRAQERCQQESAPSCAGVTSLGSTLYEQTGSSDTRMRFTLIAYDTVENAKVGAKALIASEHGDAGDKLKALSIETGADETDAFTENEHSTAVLRVGTVVAFLAGLNLAKPDDMQMLAKLQVDRIRTAATGKNPDAS